MLQIWLSRCKDLGIEEVLINLHSNAEAVRDFLHRNPESSVRVQVSDEPLLLGSAGTIRSNRDWVRDEPTFWVFYADVLTDADLQEMVRIHRERNADVTIGVYRVPDPSRCGIVQTDEYGWVKEFVEKPKSPLGNLAFSGILLGGERFLNALPEKLPSDIGFDVLPKLTDRMVAYEICDYLIDIGTMENYQSAQKDWLAGELVCEQERHA